MALSSKAHSPLRTLFSFGLALLLAWCLSGCKNSPSVNNKSNEVERVEEINFQNVASGEYVMFLIKKRQTIRALKNPPQGFYILGQVEGQTFKPKSKILGVGELAQSGPEYGWLEINTNKFFPMHSGQTAQTPFIKGYMLDSGFVPSTREIFDRP